jgi:pyruvate dehydrogenase phosphatase
MHLSGEKGLVAAVFDGHGGWQAADFAKNRFVSVLQKELHNGSATPETTSVDPVALALSRSFLRLDREFLFQVKSAFEVGFGDVARAGACALVAMVTPGGRIYIANAGDCRAVLGRRANAGSGVSKGLQAVPLSRDHNAREAEEQERLRVLHPFEEDIIR